MYIGAHVKTSGGVDKAVDRALDIGAECIQIFAASPRMWRVTPIKDKPLQSYHEKMAEAGLGPTIVHAKYLTALGSPNPELVEKAGSPCRKSWLRLNASALLVWSSILQAIGVLA